MRRVAAVLAVAGGCFDPAYSDATRCGPSGECPPGRRCAGEVCLVAAGGADAAPRHVLTLAKAAGASGIGSIQALELSAGCDSTCPTSQLSVEPGQSIQLEAFPSPGSHFQEWSGACRGSERFCTVVVDGEVTATARFTRIESNLIFATRQQISGMFGTEGVADSFCAGAAAEAGLGGQWVALISTFQVDARDRLAQARGWRRLDGKPIADTAGDLFSNREIYYPVLFDQNGALHHGPVWTGSTSAGVRDLQSCMSWAIGSGDATFGAVGRADEGPGMFRASFLRCQLLGSFYCATVDFSLPVPKPPAASGKLIYITRNGVPGTTGYAAAEARCDEEKPGAGQPVVRALLASHRAAASRFLEPAAVYVRPDGVRVGTGAEIIAGALETGIWVHGDRTYSDRLLVWTGSSAITAAEDSLTPSCGDWSTAGIPAIVGAPRVDPVSWWNVGTPVDCGEDDLPVYCIED